MWDKTKQKLNFQAQELKVPTIRMTEKKNEIDEVVFSAVCFWKWFVSL